MFRILVGFGFMICYCLGRVTQMSQKNLEEFEFNSLVSLALSEKLTSGSIIWLSYDRSCDRNNVSISWLAISNNAVPRYAYPLISTTCRGGFNFSLSYLRKSLRSALMYDVKNLFEKREARREQIALSVIDDPHVLEIRYLKANKLYIYRIDMVGVQHKCQSIDKSLNFYGDCLKLFAWLMILVGLVVYIVYLYVTNCT